MKLTISKLSAKTFWTDSVDKWVSLLSCQLRPGYILKPTIHPVDSSYSAISVHKVDVDGPADQPLGYVEQT